MVWGEPPILTAIGTEPMHPEAHDTRSTLAIEYVLGRQCHNGGFCFYRFEDLEEPNLGDTWHALASLRLLGADIPHRDTLLTWLNRYPTASLHRDALFYWTFSHRLIDPEWVPDDRIRERIRQLPLQPPGQTDDVSDALAARLRSIRLKATFGAVEPAPRIIQWLHDLHDGGYGRKPNLLDTADALELLGMLGVEDRTEDTRAFVDALQTPLLGFNNTRDSHYCRLRILYAGVRCCRRLGIPIRHPDVIVATVHAAQRPDGAFADVPGALPTLETHHQALALLAMITGAHSGTTCAHDGGDSPCTIPRQP